MSPLKWQRDSQPTEHFIMNHPQTEPRMNISYVPPVLHDLWTQLLNVSHGPTTAPTQWVFLMLLHFLKSSSQEMVFAIMTSPSLSSLTPTTESQNSWTGVQIPRITQETSQPAFCFCQSHKANLFFGAQKECVREPGPTIFMCYLYLDTVCSWCLLAVSLHKTKPV